MDKFPLTSVGISTLQELLHSLSNDKLRAEAELLAADPCAWIAAHIELEVRQLECLRIVQQDFLRMFGWNVAAALIARRPISLSYRADASRNDPAKKSCILYNCKVSSHYADNHYSSTGSLDIVITD
ncbi:hypothetical protein LRS05_15430 [Flavobacterium sp. J372]|uniref:hypothetical protein n=1 Tax=Flavobacterium sp. J372 TaxID=2898436 RepID=UPI002151A1C9|nr:hypothetical protein [Flavobacterium sp. J372]MCR5863422.1 hypothetical protein [Flavobacterium sp. J372]